MTDVNTAVGTTPKISDPMKTTAYTMPEPARTINECKRPLFDALDSDEVLLVLEAKIKTPPQDETLSARQTPKAAIATLEGCDCAHQPPTIEIGPIGVRDIEL